MKQAKKTREAKIVREVVLPLGSKRAEWQECRMARGKNGKD